MRNRGAVLIFAGGLLFTLLPFIASAAGIVPCGDTTGLAPGTPQYYAAATSCQACSVIQLIQTLINFMIGLSIPIAMALFAWAGVLYFTAATKEENISKAKSIFRSVFVGFIIVLGAYLMVETLLHAILNQDYFTGWNKIECVDNTKRPTQGTLGQLINEVIGHPEDSLVVGKAPVAVSDPSTCTGKLSYDSSINQYYCLNTVSGMVSQTGSGQCAPGSIQAAAAAGGYPITPAQAQTFSCLAAPESGCQGNPGQARTPTGDPTSASGHFQIVLGLNDQCHNLNIPACTQAAQAAGYSVSGNLNCSSHFRGGVPIDAVGQACKAAASNFTCNASAAACLVTQNPSFSDWTADPRSSSQKSCVNTYNH
ncbi:MAG TPA: pilin [Candidatus Paceibacterota bacterium]|nr:pilin [Candidatus Paceibacterota bacterium]